MIGYVLFTDLKGYSKLSESEIGLFFRKIIPELSQRIDRYLQKAIVKNTWGDALVAIFDNSHDVVGLAFEYREFFRNYPFESIGMRKLLPRIACHFGEFELYDDPLKGGKNALGSNINTAARVEPVTRAGEIFVTSECKSAIENSPRKVENIKFSDLGIIPLAKNFGDWEISRLCRANEKEQIIDRVLKMDLSKALPEAPDMAVQERNLLQFLKNAPGAEELRSLLTPQIISGKTGAFIVALANTCKSFGLYNEAIAYIEEAEKTETLVDGIKVFPYRHKKDVRKLKANCLTRVGRYEDAADIVYGLWQSGVRDSDTLSMLAAQYKRRALYGDGTVVAKASINKNLLCRARDLYLEAFRINIEDYYPAINAAYLYKIIAGIELGRGNRLALYILDVWGERRGEDWWLDSTLAEAEMLLENYEDCITGFQEAIERHKPDAFQRKAVHEQISLYASLTNQADSTEIIEVLQRLQ
ncbi:hypothetical protein GTO91_14920 [Heliobacterium undosum]|uniref:Guanylate cyclase domain-containing protein n=1 Tax=Heliomicrobium undosum TaxID=121734 RepID=A0A845LBF3_9FIRM|nr:tetratricopeptide repeat-containing protein [Heliomicrobium undosum]MZP31008.1 hypothetical protein [Heliomicrobium undosum]